MKTKAFVMYVGVAGIRTEDIEEYMAKVASKTSEFFRSLEGEVIYLPKETYDCKVECINPEYITDSELVRKHTEMIKELNQELNYQLDELKNKKNEKN
jgi:hypothetical protein